MSGGGKTDVLNRTWTLIPDPDNLDEEEDIEMALADVNHDENKPPRIRLSTLLSPLVAKSSVINNQTYSNSNESSSSSSADNNSSSNSPILNTTYNRAARNAANTTNTFSPIKSPFYLIKCLNIDFERVSIEMDNFKLRFESISDNYDSLFDENAMLLIEEEPSTRPASPVFVDGQTDMVQEAYSKPEVEFKIPNLPLPLPMPGGSSFSAASSIEDKLNEDNVTRSQKASTFNTEPAPENFHMFKHHLDKRKSVSSSTKHLDDSPFESLNNLQDSSKTTASSVLQLPKSGPKFLTSSVDKDLDSESISSFQNLAKGKLPRAIIKSLDLEEADQNVVMTSSPFKRPAIPVLSSSVSALNRTIDIAVGSVGSLNTTHTKTTCSSVDSFSHLKEFGGSVGSVNGPVAGGGAAVLNTTYNAWSASEEDVNMVVTPFDGGQHTQDFNNNFGENFEASQKKKRISGNKKVDLNQTYEMEVDNDDGYTQTMETVTTVPLPVVTSLPPPPPPLNRALSTAGIPKPATKLAIQKMIPSTAATSRLSLIQPKSSSKLIKVNSLTNVPVIPTAATNLKKPEFSRTSSIQASTTTSTTATTSSISTSNNLNTALASSNSQQPQSFSKTTNIPRSAPKFTSATSLAAVASSSKIPSQKPVVPATTQKQQIPVTTLKQIKVISSVPVASDPTRLSSSSTSSTASSYDAPKENNVMIQMPLASSVASPPVGSQLLKPGFVSKLKPPVVLTGIPSRIPSSSKLNPTNASSGGGSSNINAQSTQKNQNSVLTTRNAK